MFPATRSLVDYVNQRRQIGGQEGFPETFDVYAGEDPQHEDLLQLHLKKRHRQMMLKKMLEEAGFEDLSGKVRFSQKKYVPDQEFE